MTVIRWRIILCKNHDYLLNSALGGKLENTVNENLFALICREHVKLNVKMKEAIRLGIPLVSRNWIDWLIVHVDSLMIF